MGGSFTPTEFLYIINKLPIILNIPNFIETGTHYGNTTKLASLIFRNVYTFEINKIFYNFSKNKFNYLQINNITCELGDSILLLDKLLDNLSESIFFFLDAHHHYINTTETVQMDNGSKYTPLLDELTVINNKYVKLPGIICIDDVRLWKNNDNEDWKNISDKYIIESLNKHTINDIFEYNDRLYITINI
jgi:hypothetical protein